MDILSNTSQLKVSIVKTSLGSKKCDKSSYIDSYVQKEVNTTYCLTLTVRTPLSSVVDRWRRAELDCKVSGRYSPNCNS